MKIIILSFLLFTSLTAVGQQSCIKGVVTYYFNEYQGDKADVGARVYIHKIDSVQKDSSFMADYFSAKNMLSILELTKKNKNYPNKEKYLNRLKQLNVDTKSGLDSLDRRTYKRLLNVEYDKNTIKLTVDGIGNYSTVIEPGYYEVIIISKGRTDIGEMEVSGKIFHQTFKAENNKTLVIDKRFDQY